MKIPIIINNRNLFTWPKKMFEDLSKFEDVGDIIIVDNNSTYEPLLEWYLTKPCEIIYSDNLGQISPWVNNIPEKRQYQYYVVTDPDLDLSETPKNSLNYLLEKVQNHKKFSKIGLSLCNYNVSVDSPYHYFLKTWSYHNWDLNDLEDGLLMKQPIDTTFALYDIKRPRAGESCSAYTPYSAKHIPWEFTNEQLNNLEFENFEFFYYLKHATNASSFKFFTGLNKKL
jgi:hypothetical protein